MPPALRFQLQSRSWHSLAHYSPAVSRCIRRDHLGSSGASGLRQSFDVAAMRKHEGEGRAALVTERGGKSSLCKRMLLMNTRRPTHFTILRQLEGSCTGRGASSRVSLNLSKKTSIPRSATI